MDSQKLPERSGYIHMTAAACLKRTDVSLSDEEVAKTTHAAVKRSVHLQRYFIEQGVSDASRTAIDMCADEVFEGQMLK